jgi:phosphonate degradation associated HDIG domain protein
VNATAHAYEALEELFDGEGRRDYLGEQVSMAQHMLQAAAVARRSGAPPALVVAALVHDVGHFTGVVSGRDLMAGTDDHHDEVAAAWLSGWFGEEVTEPVRLHVQAKRYLCAVDPGYLDELSEASRYTLRVQGGPMSAGEVAAFAESRYAERATRLRRFDDRAKDPRLGDLTLAEFGDDVRALDRTLVGPPRA